MTLVGDILYAPVAISTEVRAQLLEMGVGPFALEVFDARDEGFERVVAQVRAGKKMVVVLQLGDLGVGSRQVVARLAAVSSVGGWTYDVLGGILGSEKQSRAIVRALQWARGVDFARNSAARSAGRRRAAPSVPGALSVPQPLSLDLDAMCSCGHLGRAHEKGSRWCWKCISPTDELKCPRFERAAPTGQAGGSP